MNTFLFFVEMTYLFGRTVKSLALKKAKSGPIFFFFFFFLCTVLCRLDSKQSTPLCVSVCTSVSGHGHHRRIMIDYDSGSTGRKHDY